MNIKVLWSFSFIWLILAILAVCLVTLFIPNSVHAVELDDIVSDNGTVIPNPEGYMKDVWDKAQMDGLLSGNRVLVPQSEGAISLFTPVKTTTKPIIYEPPIYRRFFCRLWWLWVGE